MPPDPAISYSASAARPAPVLTSPEPAMPTFIRLTSTWPSLRLPDPATPPSNVSPETLSTDMLPEPAISAAVRLGTVTVSDTLWRFDQPKLMPERFLG